MQYRSYEAGDLVVPTGLPKSFVCRVIMAHSVGATDLQVLELMALHGPWPAGTRLFRGSDAVRTAVPSELRRGSATEAVREPHLRLAKRHARRNVPAEHPLSTRGGAQGPPPRGTA